MHTTNWFTEPTKLIRSKYLLTMGGKSYYCDYCDCFMKNDINVRKSHNIGMIHNVAKANYLQAYKDPQQIVTEEKKKIPCKRFLNNKTCQFGFFCRYSHYSPEELAYMEWIVDKNKNNENGSRNNVVEKKPWNYPNGRKNLPQLTPSLRPIDFNMVTESCFLDHWG